MRCASDGSLLPVRQAPRTQHLRLDLSHNGIGDDGCAELLSTLLAPGSLPQLIALGLDLADNEVAADGCVAIRDAICSRCTAGVAGEAARLRRLWLGLAHNAIHGGAACAALGDAVFRPLGQAAVRENIAPFYGELCSDGSLP